MGLQIWSRKCKRIGGRNYWLKPNCKDTLLHMWPRLHKKDSQTQAVRHADQTRQYKYYWKTLTTDIFKWQNTALMVRVNCYFLSGWSGDIMNIKDNRTMHWAKALTICNHIIANNYLIAYTAEEIEAQRVKHTAIIILVKPQSWCHKMETNVGKARPLPQLLILQCFTQWYRKIMWHYKGQGLF